MKFILQESNKLILDERFILQEATDETDWAAKYNAATNKEAVWEEYLNTVWETDFDRVNEISEAFEQECKTYGFDDTNPFITFIKEVYLKTTMPKACYETIHNAVVDQYISSKDLLGKGKLGKFNIIFCPNLYDKDAANIATYLKKQSMLLSKKLPEVCDTELEFVANILYKLDALKKDSFFRALSPDKLKLLELNTFAKINELETKLSGSVSTEERSRFKVDDAFIESISTLDEAAKILICLMLKFPTNMKLRAAVEHHKETAELLSAATTGLSIFEMLGDFDTRFKLKDIKENQAAALATKIINSAKFEFTRI